MRKLSKKPIFYVYIYLDPRKPGKYKYGEYTFKFEPFYIGKGSGDRIYRGLYASQKDANPYKNRKINKIKTKGYDLKNKKFIFKIHENLNEKEAFKFEKLLIKTIGRHDKKKGPLTNLTDGGEGPSGIIMSESTKRKLIKSLTGRKMSDETKQKISQSNKGKTRGRGRKATEEGRKNMSIAAKKRGIPREIQELGWAACRGKPSWNKGLPLTDEWKENLSKSLKGRKVWNKGIPMLDSVREKMRNNPKITNSNRKISLEQADEIQKLKKDGVTYTKLMVLFSLSKTQLIKIVKGRVLYLQKNIPL